MTTLIVGASGATGRLLVEQLINRGEQVKIIVRSSGNWSELSNRHDSLTITQASLLDMTDAQLLEQVQDCRAVVSCLGHNLTLKGMFGQPRRLVTDGIQRLCHAIEKTNPESPVKVILMNTSGNQNKLAGELVSTSQSIVIGLLRQLLPPHADNETAAAYLQSSFGTSPAAIEWAAVRPDGLIDEPLVSDYSIHPSPIRSAIFDAGKTSRINVAHFMSELVVDNATWNKWQGQMPVIYNS